MWVDNHRISRLWWSPAGRGEGRGDRSSQTLKGGPRGPEGAGVREREKLETRAGKGQELDVGSEIREVFPEEAGRSL